MHPCTLEMQLLEGPPNDFDIEDEPGKNSFYLLRTYKDEEIVIEVNLGADTIVSGQVVERAPCSVSYECCVCLTRGGRLQGKCWPRRIGMLTGSVQVAPSQLPVWPRRRHGCAELIWSYWGDDFMACARSWYARMLLVALGCHMVRFTAKSSKCAGQRLCVCPH